METTALYNAVLRNGMKMRSENLEEIKQNKPKNNLI